MKNNYRKLKFSILLQTVLVTALTVLVGGVILRYVIDGIYNDQIADAIIKIMMDLGVNEQKAIDLYWNLLAHNKDFFTIVGFLLLFALFFYIALSKMTKYLDQVGDGIENIASDSTDPIRLITELKPIEIRLNEIKAKLKSHSQKEFATPGAGDDFIQQGFCYAGDDVLLASGYMKGKKPSRIYIVKGTNYDDRTTTYVQLKDENGNYTTNHAGGVSVFKDKVYVCNSEGDPSSVLIYSLSEILSANEGDDVVAKQNVPVHTNASFCHVDGGVLYVGEFYMDGKYNTDDSHKTTTPSGDENNAMIFAYPLDTNGNFASDKPVGAFSITDKIQGMVFAPNKIVLSSSYGLATSKIYVYDVQTVNSQQKGNVVVEGKTIPLVYLDENSLVDTISAPPMAEEMVYLNGRLMVIGESASNKYIFGKLLRAKHVWSIEL